MITAVACLWVVIFLLAVVVYLQKCRVDDLADQYKTATERQYATDESLQDITGVLLVMLSGNEDEVEDDDGLPSTLED